MKTNRSIALRLRDAGCPKRSIAVNSRRYAFLRIGQSFIYTDTIGRLIRVTKRPNISRFSIISRKQ